MKDYYKIIVLFFLFLISCKEKTTQDDNQKNEKQHIIDSISRIANYNSLDNPDIAIKEYSKILEIDSNNLNALGNRGVILMNNGYYNKAIIDFSDVIKIKDNNNDTNGIGIGNYYLWRGECKYNLGDYHGALRDFDQVEKYNLDVDDLYIYRAYSFLKIGDLNKACFNFSIAGERGYSKAYNEINTYCN